jgi:hypothetical protein
MGQTTNAYNILVAHPENRRPLGRPRRREKVKGKGKVVPVL